MRLLEIEELRGEIEIPKMGSWRESFHLFDEDSVWAVNAALMAQRPLLVRGEPGVGKSQLARAVAAVLKRTFVSVVVHAHSECQDLLYHFDAVARLGKAQSLIACNDSKHIKKELDPVKFLSPGPIWWAFDWKSAQAKASKCHHAVYTPKIPPESKKENGCVLLIDEIDKADSDLPNGLLETLGNGAFSVPYMKDPVELNEDRPPLVIITTNEERELPNAFLRRCLVLHMDLLEDQKELEDWLVERGQIHFSDCAEEVLREAAKQLCKDRSTAKKLSLPLPGQAEYLDILRALTKIGGNKDKQLDNLKKIGKFALRKSPKESYS